MRVGCRVEVDPGYGWRDGVLLAYSAVHEMWFVRYRNDGGHVYTDWFRPEHIRLGDFA